MNALAILLAAALTVAPLVIIPIVRFLGKASAHDRDKRLGLAPRGSPASYLTDEDKAWLAFWSSKDKWTMRHKP